ncbi:VapE domain-containing protein [Cardinium endosymbiont of Nabis limbatus]|uniref:VapE domain-containing protein n=1 Tax=Cardinium endosymbiont of Nabis limbatus TaxID=3066217 RepID=UPI003AF3ADA6
MGWYCKEADALLPSSITRNLQIQYIPFSKNNSFSKLFLDYWAQFKINQEILEKFDVRQVAEVSFISNTYKFICYKYTYTKKLAACYHIDDRVKIYVPKVPAAFSNDQSFPGQEKYFGYKDQLKSDVFGLSQLPSGNLPYIMFTAGEKDCMSAHAHGFIAIAMQSENQFPTKELIKELRGRASVLLCCYDNDVSGINASNRLMDDLSIVPIKLPENIKDLAEYFQIYTATFQILLDQGINKNKCLKPIQLASKVTELEEDIVLYEEGNTVLHKVRNYLRSKYKFRFNIIKHHIQICARGKTDQWQMVNSADVWSELVMNKIKISRCDVRSVLESSFVEMYNPIKSYFLQFDRSNLGGQDYILELSKYVFLEDTSDSAASYWYNHLRKWMIRAIRTVFEDDAINKHVLILSSRKENIGKSFFCQFLCPPALKAYYNGKIIIRHEKDFQSALTSCFIINLDELNELTDKDISRQIKSWISLPSINIRLPYEREETTKPRIASILGTTNDLEFLDADSGYSRWIGFRVSGTKYIDDAATDILEEAWCQAYKLYKENNKSGELTLKEIEANKEYALGFMKVEAETDLIERFLTSSNNEAGVFMTTTEIQEYLFNRSGTSIRLSTKLIGSSLSKLGFRRISRRVGSKIISGYWICTVE